MIRASVTNRVGGGGGGGDGEGPGVGSGVGVGVGVGVGSGVGSGVGDGVGVGGGASDGEEIGGVVGAFDEEHAVWPSTTRTATIRGSARPAICRFTLQGIAESEPTSHVGTL